MNLRPNLDDRLVRGSDEGGWFRFPGPWRFLLLIILIVCLLTALWYLFAPARKTYSLAELPLIQADEGPIKVKAEDQGIPTIKHQDKLVYGRISGEENEVQVEHILPDPERPLDPFNDPSPLKMVEQYVPDDLDPNAKAPPKEEPQPQTLTSIEDLIEAAPEEKKLSEEKKPPPPTKRSGTTFVQLASLKSYDSAESEWSRLSKRHAHHFSGLEPSIQKVDLGASQGIYYRLRTGPFETEAKAKAFCSALAEHKVECRVIH